MATTFPIRLGTDTGYAVRQRSVLAPADGKLKLAWVYKGEPQQNAIGHDYCAAKLRVTVNGGEIFSKSDNKFGTFDFSDERIVVADAGVQYDIVMDRTGTHDIRDNVQIDFVISFTQP